MYFSMSTSKTNNTKWYYYGIHNTITKSKFEDMWIIENNMYVNIIILCKTTIYFRTLFYWDTKSRALTRNKCENSHYWKKQKNIAKKL